MSAYMMTPSLGRLLLQNLHGFWEWEGKAVNLKSGFILYFTQSLPWILLLPEFQSGILTEYFMSKLEFLVRVSNQVKKHYKILSNEKIKQPSKGKLL